MPCWHLDHRLRKHTAWAKHEKHSPGCYGMGGKTGSRGKTSDAVEANHSLEATHLYQAPNVGYVWRGVAHSFIFLHLQKTRHSSKLERARHSPRMATSANSTAPPQFAKNLSFLLAAPEPAAGGTRPPPQWGTQARDELSFRSQTAQPAKAQRPHSQGEL